jgi:c-di-GMP-binding flagellar brake protein YcgR
VRCSKCQQIFKVFPPQVANRRKHPRIKTRNLISHFTFDEHGKPVSQGLSKAIDISRGGIALETPNLIEPGLISLMAVGLDNKFIEIKGELVYSKRTDSGMYRSGIKFVGTDEQVRNFVVGLIKEYNYRKNNFLISLDP